VSLIGVDLGHITSKVAIRFANLLRNLIPSTDVAVMEMTANAMGRLALASGTITAEYVEYEAKRAFEWLSGDRHEGRRHAAVSAYLFVLYVV
jgi:FKBP12-rapamycin complex-associated protein